MEGDRIKVLDRGANDRPGRNPPPLTAVLSENGEVAAIPKTPGHSIRVVQLTSRGQRWVARCECGYVSASRTTDAVALGAAVHHLRKVAKALRENGSPTQVRRLA